MTINTDELECYTNTPVVINTLCVAGRHMSVILIRGALGAQRMMNRPTVSYHTAVMEALIAGDSSARACHVGAYLF